MTARRPARPAAPRHLSKRARELWSAIVREYVVDDAAGLELLRRLCEASDRADAARELLDVDGLVLTTRFGETKAHPAVAIERDARIAVARLARELRITEPEAELDARPPRLGRRS